MRQRERERERNKRFERVHISRSIYIYCIIFEDNINSFFFFLQKFNDDREVTSGDDALEDTKCKMLLFDKIGTAENTITK